MLSKTIDLLHTLLYYPRHPGPLGLTYIPEYTHTHTHIYSHTKKYSEVIVLLAKEK